MADDGGQSGVPANPAGQDGGVQATLFTQDHVNHFTAEAKRGALGGYFKDLGFDSPPTAEELKAQLTYASEYQKLKEGQKGDIERLTGELTSVKEAAARIPELETIVNRQRIAAELALPTKVWNFIEGKTDDEIKESVKGIRTILGMSEEPEAASEDSGSQDGKPRPPRPAPGQGGGPGGKPKSTMSSGFDLYKSKHPDKKE